MAYNEDVFKAFLDLSEKTRKPLASINQSALSSLTKLVSEIDTSIFKVTQISLSNVSMFPQIYDSIISLSKSYAKLYSKNSFLDEAYISKISELQVSSILHLSQSVDTNMIKELNKCFSYARYNEIISVLNKSLSLKKLKASDISFFKNSELVEVLKSELKYPKGFISSLSSLNKSTANEISKNYVLAYSTDNNAFISNHGEIKSSGLNVICSGKEFFATISDELFSENELIDFNSFLYSSPMLGPQNDVGTRIYNFINELYKSSKSIIGFDRNHYYHCRSRKKTEMPYAYEQMLKAPIGLPWAGRFNCPGRSNYYFSNTQKGAEAEVKKHLTDDDILQTVKLRPVGKIKMLDLSGKITKCSIFLRYLRFDLKDFIDNWPREYLLPCFVGQCCRDVGFEGIKYFGSKEYDNYVTWNDGFFEYAGMCL